MNTTDSDKPWQKWIDDHCFMIHEWCRSKIERPYLKIDSFYEAHYHLENGKTYTTCLGDKIKWTQGKGWILNGKKRNIR